MDDFLHNLRSGKLKQQDRNRSIYNDQYKGKRRTAMDHRRKVDSDAKEAVERLDAIKTILEGISQTQKRMADAYEATAQAEVRKAEALETIARGLRRWIDSAERAGNKALEAKKAKSETVPADESKPAGKRNGRMTEDERQEIFNIIDKMRQSGQSWTNIARHLGENGYATVSGKGIWRGQGVKTFYTRMGGAAV